MEFMPDRHRLSLTPDDRFSLVFYRLCFLLIGLLAYLCLWELMLIAVDLGFPLQTTNGIGISDVTLIYMHSCFSHWFAFCSFCSRLRPHWTMFFLSLRQQKKIASGVIHRPFVLYWIYIYNRLNLAYGQFIFARSSGFTHYAVYLFYCISIIQLYKWFSWW